MAQDWKARPQSRTANEGTGQLDRVVRLLPKALKIDPGKDRTEAAVWEHFLPRQRTLGVKSI